MEGNFPPGRKDSPLFGVVLRNLMMAHVQVLDGDRLNSRVLLQISLLTRALYALVTDLQGSQEAAWR